MKEQILRLCKRLKQFTLDEITTITELEQEEIKPILEEFVKENKLSKINGQYLYKKKENIISKYQTFQYFSKDKIDLVIRCFCSDIPTTKVVNITGICHTTIENFYNIFRKTIYERQFSNLKNLYAQNKQKYRRRNFFGNLKMYFYIYENIVYVTKNPLTPNSDELPAKKDRLDFKKIYCYIRRQIESHVKNKTNLEHKIAEVLWRRNKSFTELYDDLKKFLFIE